MKQGLLKLLQPPSNAAACPTARLYVSGKGAIEKNDSFIAGNTLFNLNVNFSNKKTY